MAYGELYRFSFDANNGPEVTISIEKKDYTGAAYGRAVGGSAVLKRERNGHILGSSLQWSAECVSDDEFADLYTSDPTLYRVTVLFDRSRVWRGFITPELYSAPWVNAPYDISLTASDNLAELKNYEFEEQGNKTVRELLLLLLGKTDQDVTSITAISSLSGDGNGILSLTVNMDAMTGSTYYEVLDGLLETFHAYIRFDAVNLRWLILRETDISDYSGISYLTFSSLSGSGRLFPVGNLSMEIEPARKEITVSEEIVARNIADEFNEENMKTILGTPTWKDKEVYLYERNTQTTNGPAHSYDAIAGVLFPRVTSGRKYRLTFRARAGKKNDRGEILTTNTKIRYGLIISDANGKSIYYNEEGKYSSEYSGDDYPISVEIGATFSEYSLSFEIPLSVDDEDFVALKGSFAARVDHINAFKARDWQVLARLTDVELHNDDFPDGLATKVILDNSARTIGDEVTLAFGADIDKGRKNIIQETAFTSAAITEAKDFNSFMAIDNALSVATPRLRLSGLIMSKTAAWALPEFVRTAHSSADNLDYLVEEYSFNLITGEIDISMLSLPAVSLSYTSLETVNTYGGGSSGSSGGSSGSSGGSSGSSGGSGAANNGHTHSNKEYLDQITTDKDGYIYLTQSQKVEDPDTGETTIELVTEKAKAGFADTAKKAELADVAKDLTEDSPVRKQFLSRLADDVAKGNITFERMITVLGLSVFKGGAQFGEFVKNLYAGKGAGIDELGNAEFESVRVRSYFECLELIINRLSAIEGDQLLTECDTVESVDDLGDNCYGLHLRSKWDGYFTAQSENNVLKGIVNTLAAGSGVYYTSWLRVNSVNTANNYIEVTLYPDEETPAGKNYAPCEIMKIARWGNQTDTKRQSCIYLSSTEGRIVRLTGVTKPIIDASNYGATFGTLPEFLRAMDLPIIEGQDYVYARGLVVQDIIRIDYQGRPVSEVVDRGLWDAEADYYCEALNPATNIYEISDVWYNGCKYRCAKTGTKTAPAWNNTDWAMVEGNPEFTVEFADTDYIFDPDRFALTLSVIAKLYNMDVTADILDADVQWTRYSEDADGNERVASDQAWALKRAGAGKAITLTTADCDFNGYVPKTLKFIATVTLRDGMGNVAGTENAIFQY